MCSSDLANEEAQRGGREVVRVIDQVNLSELSSAMTRISEFQRLVQARLRAGLDYGVIPGTSKMTLLKPGAEKICMLLGLRSEFDIMDTTRDFESGFFQYQVKCRLYWGDMLITEGMGAANTRETRYRGRDAYTLDNTVLKMGKKRALVDAALMVGSLSDIFTQDMEDFEDSEPEDVGPSRSGKEARDKAREPAQEEKAAKEKSQVSKEAVHAVYSMGRAAGLSDEKLRELFSKTGLSDGRSVTPAKLEEWKSLIIEHARRSKREVN